MDLKKRQTLQFGTVLLIAGLSWASAAEKAAPVTLDPGAVTLINVLTCDPANQAALVDELRENTNAVVTTLDGWKSTSLVVSQDGTHITIISQWRDAAAVAAMRADERMKTHFPKVGALAKVDSVFGGIAYTRHA